jgi:PAS domain S-box-containing protein
MIGIVQDITERMVSEAALAESERRYRNLYQYAQVGLFETSLKDGLVVACNQRYADLFGADSAEATIGQDVRSIYVNPDDRAYVARTLRETGQINDHVVQFRNKLTGRLFWGQFSARYNYERDVAEGTIIDITAQKDALEALGESEARFRQFFEGNSAVMIMLDPETGAIIDANTAASELTGYSREVLLSMNITEINKLLPTEVAQLRSEIAGEIRKSFFAPLQRADGSLRTMEIYSTPVRVKGRIYLFSVIHDVTERMAAETALAESAERFRRAQDAANAGTWEWDLPTNRNFWSEKVWDLYGLDAVKNPASYDSWLESIRPEDRAGVAQVIQEAAAKGIPIMAEWRVNRGPAQKERWLMSRGQPVVDETGIVKKYRGIVIDITEQKVAEHQREALIRELEQKNAELERFTYTVSHDLKSPLITIKGFAGLLEDDAHKGDPVQLRKDILRITTAADTMQALLADLLELSKVGRIVGTPKKIGFDTLAREAVDLLAVPLAERGVTIEIAPDLPEVNVDPTRIREVLVNLIENAIKFLGNRPDPLIRIGVELDGDGPVFFVQDNGIGIDPRYLERVFNLFEKLDPNSLGTGIGLTIVRRIIVFHGGKIWADSEGPGKGTTFRFTLPVVPKDGGDRYEG